VHGASWIDAWWAWVAVTTLQGTLLLAVASVADRLFVRRVWPQVLRVLWLCALARFLVPPDLGSPLSITRGLSEPVLRTAESFAPGQQALVALFAIWLAGVAGCLLSRTVHRARLRARVLRVTPGREWLAVLERARGKIGSRSTPRLGVRLGMRIGTLDGLATPAVFGLFRPWLLVPREWLARAPATCEHALAHELAHIARGDLWLDELCATLRALLWFHPLAWIAASRVHELGEIACDQTVSRALGTEARAYRDTLVLTAAALPVRPAPVGLRAFCARPSSVVLRVEILDSSFACSRWLVGAVTLVVALVLAACVLPMNDPSVALRVHAERVFALERSGDRQSCFALQAAALVLSADPQSPRSGP
jgi:beta-lactamase regulating signal transducer with metallopeptidase domain